VSASCVCDRPRGASLLILVAVNLPLRHPRRTRNLSPERVAFSPDGSLAYITNTDRDSVSVIDTTTNTVTAAIAVGGAPSGVAAPRSMNHPGFHAHSGFCEPAGWLAPNGS